MITTRDGLKKYILEELGSPFLEVELSDSQLNHSIDKSIQEYTTVAFDGQQTKYIKFNCQGRGTYKVSKQIDEITNIAKSGIFNGGFDMSGWVDQNLSNYILSSSGVALSYLVTLSATRSLTEKYFKKSIAYEFNCYKSELVIFEDFHGPLLIEAKMQYIPDDEDDKIFDAEWVKKMATAQARLLQSIVLGKYDQALINGSHVNYADMRSMAETDIENLRQELKDKWQNPAIMMIG